MLTQLFETLRQSRRVLLSTHQLPDGDGLGAECALAAALRQLHKQVVILNPDRIPDRYGFLEAFENFCTFSEQGPLESFDLWIIVDTNDPRRLGPRFEEQARLCRSVVFLDHHPELTLAGMPILPNNSCVISDTDAGSIGEMVDHILAHFHEITWNPSISIGLYTSVMTDTNSFRYARTTPHSHEIAARAIRAGINPEEVIQSIYSSKTLDHLRLLGIALQEITSTADESIAWIVVRKQWMETFSAQADDTLFFINLLLLHKRSEIVCVFREEAPAKTRVSIKSKGKHRVHLAAERMGGGGHPFAAGCRINHPLSESIDLMISELQKAIEVPSN